MRFFIDKPGGVGVDDCALVSNQLARLLAVEGIDYAHLEVSSPGLDRLLKKESDFIRFAGESARIRLKTPVSGQRKYVGILRDVKDGKLQLEVDGRLLLFELANLERARLVPKI